MRERERERESDSECRSGSLSVMVWVGSTGILGLKIDKARVGGGIGFGNCRVRARGGSSQLVDDARVIDEGL